MSGSLPLSPTEARFLQRLAADEPPRRPLSKSAAWFFEHYGLGTAYARHVEYLPRHFEQARELLNLHGISPSALSPDANRADAARFPGQSEKTQSRAPWSNTVAVKVPASSLTPESPSSPGAFAVLTVEQAIEVPCDRLLVVENLETFRYLEHYQWLHPRLRRQRTLAIYRGDATTSTADASDVLRRRPEPVLAFTDFDPAGLGIAAALPRLQSLLLPHDQWLRDTARGARGLELFERSRVQYQAVLDAAEHPDIRQAWALMKSLSAGVAQEAMREARAGLEAPV